MADTSLGRRPGAQALGYFEGARYGYVAQDEADRVVLEQPDVWVGGEHGAGARAGAYGVVGIAISSNLWGNLRVVFSIWYNLL